MSMIKDYMSGDHRECDEHFPPVEDAVMADKWDDALMNFITFKNSVLKHFKMEEDVLFPEMEEIMGGGEGPVHIMKMEHNQVRSILDQMGESIEEKNRDKFLGLSDTFMILIQQHNMKEEQILYNMADQILGDAQNTLEEMKKVEL